MKVIKVVTRVSQLGMCEISTWFLEHSSVWRSVSGAFLKSRLVEISILFNGMKPQNLNNCSGFPKVFLIICIICK